MKFRPCIDLHKGRVKQIVGKTLRENAESLVEHFVSRHDASYYAELFRHDGLAGGHVIMLGTGNSEQALKALRAYPNGLQVGGGINAENGAFYLENGASHVIVTSYIFSRGMLDLENLERLVRSVGKDRLVLDLSCRKREDAYFVVTGRWQEFTDFEITRDNLGALDRYCDEFLIHGVDVEGQRSGILKDLVVKLGEWVTVPTTYAGGVRSLEDLDEVYELGKGRIDITVGSALDIFGGSLPYRSVVTWQPPSEVN